MKDRESWCAAVHGVVHNLATEQQYICDNMDEPEGIMLGEIIQRKTNTMGSQFSSAAQSHLTLCDSMDCSTPGLPVFHYIPEFTQIYVH